jgi:hypothetical protein
MRRYAEIGAIGGGEKFVHHHGKAKIIAEVSDMVTWQGAARMINFRRSKRYGSAKYDAINVKWRQMRKIIKASY